MKSMALEEKRHLDRKACVAEVNWAYFGQPMDNDGQIMNFSKKGVCLTTKIEVQPHTTVWYRVVKFISGCWVSDQPECLRSISVANVKWCIEVTEGSENTYITGLKYQ